MDDQDEKNKLIIKSFDDVTTTSTVSLFRKFNIIALGGRISSQNLVSTESLRQGCFNLHLRQGTTLSADDLRAFLSPIPSTTCVVSDFPKAYEVFSIIQAHHTAIAKSTSPPSLITAVRQPFLSPRLQGVHPSSSKNPQFAANQSERDRHRL